MELQNAFEIIFNDSTMEAAISAIKADRERAGDLLLKRLKESVQSLREAPENEQRPDITLNKTLDLLRVLEIKETFPVLLGLMRIDSCCRAVSPQMLVSCLLAVIPDESGAQQLRAGLLEETICPAGKRAACIAVVAFYQKAERPQETEAFFSELVSFFEKKGTDNFGEFDLLFCILQLCRDWDYIRLNGKLKSLLIQLIIHSESGFDASWFRDYFCYLYQLDPLIAAKIHGTEDYIRSLYRCKDPEIFEFETMEDIGRYLCAKTFGTVKGINLDIVKIAIKRLKRYPFNERPYPISDEQYYREICAYLGLKRIPKDIYTQADALYREVFIDRYSALKKRIECLIRNTEQEQRETDRERTDIIEKSNQAHSLFKEMDMEIRQLARNEIRAKELNSLHQQGAVKGVGMLDYIQSQVERFFLAFCGEACGQETPSDRLREISIQCAYWDNVEIEDYFRPYRQVLEHLETLLTEDPNFTLQNMFYHVKFIPFAEQLQKEYKNQIYAAEETERDGIVDEIRQKEKEHPLYPANLIECTKEGPAAYAAVLEHYIPQTVESIRTALDRSVCLTKRKAVIQQCLDMIECGDNELVINLLPVQMEGLFADLLEYTTIYKYIDNIKLYKSLLNLELAEKIERGGTNDVNIPLDAAAYFKYYFSSVIRNTVAHGNYFLLAESRGIHGDWSEDSGDDCVKRILALELLLDLNYLVRMISETNEIDTAKRYIESTAKHCMETDETDREILYDCLFKDLNQTRDRINLSQYKFGIFVTYNARQIMFWMFNPYYEKYIDAESLHTVRTAVCSAEFWKYIQKYLNKSETRKWSVNEFDNTVKRLLKIQRELMDRGLMEQDTVDLMKKVSNLLEER